MMASSFGGDFPSIAMIVLHSLEGFFLWSSVSTNCLHVFLRSSFVVLVVVVCPPLLCVAVEGSDNPRS